MQLTINIDARQALGQMQAMPEAVRSNLRRVLPQLGKDLGAQIEANMDSRLQSHRRLKVTKQMIENPKTISVRVALTWTGEATKKLVPTYLEGGTKPHVIRAVNAKMLAFYWDKVGGMFFTPKVNHPGNPPYRLVQDAFEAQRGVIYRTMELAVKEAAAAKGPIR